MKLLRVTSIAGLEADLANYESNITNNEALLVVINGIDTTEGSVANIVLQSKTYTDSLLVDVDLSQVALNQNALATLNGDETVEGSVAKAVLDNINNTLVTPITDLTPIVTANTTAISDINDTDATTWGVTSVYKQIFDLRDGVDAIYDTVVEVAQGTLDHDADLINLTDTATTNRTYLEQLESDHQTIVDDQKIVTEQKFVDEAAIQLGMVDTGIVDATVKMDARYYKIASLLEECKVVPERLPADANLMENTTIVKPTIEALTVGSKVYLNAVTNSTITASTPTNIFETNSYSLETYVSTIDQAVYDTIRDDYNADQANYKLEINLDNDLHGVTNGEITYTTSNGDKIKVIFPGTVITAGSYELNIVTYDAANGFVVDTPVSIAGGTEDIIVSITDISTGPTLHRVISTVSTDYNFISGKIYEFEVSEVNSVVDGFEYIVGGVTDIDVRGDVLYNGQATARFNLGIFGATETVDLTIDKQDKYKRINLTVVGEVITLEPEVLIQHVKWIHILYPNNEFDTIYLENGANPGEFKAQRIAAGDMDGESVEVRYVLQV